MRTMPKLCVGIVFASLGASLSNAEAADEPPPATTAPPATANCLHRTKHRRLQPTIP